MASASYPSGGITPAAELAFYQDHLTSVVLPFWLTRSVDETHGGFFTCFDNEGRHLLSEDKFTWSQGRIVWVWAKLASMDMFSRPERERFCALARSGAEFLMRHCVLPSGACTFLMARDGTPKRLLPDLPLDSSIYADCFVVGGLSRYASLTGNREAAQFAWCLFVSVRQRLASGVFMSEPYPVPRGYRAHGIPMIMLNTSQEMGGALAALGMAEAGEARTAAEEYLHQVLHFVAPDGSLREFIAADCTIRNDTLIGRYTNPGHTLEDMWFVMHQMQTMNNGVVPATDLATITKVIRHAFSVGWDDQYGGLFQFTDSAGGPPSGDMAGMGNDRMVQKVLSDWSNKLWWVHSEALYTTLLAYWLTGSPDILALYRKTRDYTFHTFPNPDRSIREWIQIRNREGRPVQKVVALPVKDPYHIIRNLALIIDLLRSW